MKTANSSPDSIGPKRQLSLPAGRQHHEFSGPQLPAVSHSPPRPSVHSSVHLLWDPPAPDDVWRMSVYSDSYRCALRPFGHPWTPVKHLHISIVRTVVCLALWLDYLLCIWPEPAGIWCCVFVVVHFRPCHERFQGGNIGRVTLLVVNVAQLYYRVCILAKVCLVIQPNGHIWASSQNRKWEWLDGWVLLSVPMS